MASALLVLATPALLSAQVVRREPPPRVTLAPIIGYRFGGEVDDASGDRVYVMEDRASFGIRLAVRAGRNIGGAFIFSRQESEVHTVSDSGITRRDLRVDYWMVGTFREYPRLAGRLRPFVDGALGLAHFSPREGGIVSPNRLAVSAGGGALLQLNPWLGVQASGRGFLTFVRGGTGIFCSAGCAVTFRGSGLLQTEVLAGIVISVR